MTNNKKRDRKSSKESHVKREWDFDDYTNMTLNVALCFAGLSVPCFIIGCSGLGFVLLVISGIVMLLIHAAFFFWAVVIAKILKHIPHR